MNVLEILHFIEDTLKNQAAFKKNNYGKAGRVEKHQRYCQVLTQIRDALLNQKAEPNQAIADAINVASNISYKSGSSLFASQSLAQQLGLKTTESKLASGRQSPEVGPPSSFKWIHSTTYEQQLKEIFGSLQNCLKNGYIFNYQANSKGEITEPATVIQEWKAQQKRDSQNPAIKDFRRDYGLDGTTIREEVAKIKLTGRAVTESDDAIAKRLTQQMVEKSRYKDKALIEQWILKNGGQDTDRFIEAMLQNSGLMLAQPFRYEQKWKIGQDGYIHFNHEVSYYGSLQPLFHATKNGKVTQLTNDEFSTRTKAIDTAARNYSLDTIKDIDPLVQIKADIVLKVVKNEKGEPTVELQLQQLTIVSNDRDLDAGLAQKKEKEYSPPVSPRTPTTPP